MFKSKDNFKIIVDEKLATNSLKMK